MRHVLLCLAILTPAVAGAAELFRWVDKDGTVHYADKAGPNSTFMNLKSTNGDGPSAEQLARSAACTKAKAELEDYRGATTLQQQDALGNVKVFTEAERTKFLDLQEQKMKSACAAPEPAPTPASASANVPVPTPLNAPKR